MNTITIRRLVQSSVYLLSLCLSTGTLAQNVKNYTQIDALHYTFDLTISDDNDKIIGKVNVLFRNKKESLETTYLDLNNTNEENKGMSVSQVLLNDKELTFMHRDGRLQFSFNEPLPSSYVGTLTINYEGVPADGLVISKNEYGERTFFGDNWPNRAQYWLPTVDHPSDKATCEFIIKSPQNYKVIANGTLREESFTGFSSDSPQKLTHWVMSQPIPTKVMVFGAARFAVLYDQEVNGISIQHWVYADNRDTAFKDFEPTANVLTYFLNRIGPYPYEKLANVESKTRYGGMENASNIFYNEQAVDGDQSIEALIAHEVAHQWFGNSVSEKSWEHVWLSEGFATYMTHTYIEHTYGSDSLNKLLQADKNKIFNYFQKAPDEPVVNENQDNLYQILNANTYQKGAWFLHMLRLEVGDKYFWEGISKFYDRYKFSKANTDDFRKVIEEVSSQELSNLFSLWLNTPGHPILKGNWKYSGMGKKAKINLEQVQNNNVLYELPLEIGIYYPDKIEPEIHTIAMNKKVASFTLKLANKPTNLVIDPFSKILVDSQLFTNR